MSSNFLDTNGGCAGADFHLYIACGPMTPAGPAPLPVKFCPHGVVKTHSGDQKTWRRTTTVTTETKPVLQSQWSMLLVPHIFVPMGAPHPALEPPNIAVIIIGSSASPQLAVHSVTGNGQQLLAELSGSMGLNLDCSDLPAVGLSVDLNLNTVMTTPSLGDYVAAAISAAGSIGYSWIGGKLGQKFKLPDVAVPIIMTVLDALASNPALALLDPVNFVINKIAEIAQKAVD